jgi:hypothetical protein
MVSISKKQNESTPMLFLSVLVASDAVHLVVKVRPSETHIMASFAPMYCKSSRNVDHLVLRLAASHLLSLEVLVQQIQSLLVGTGAAGDGEHTLASVVVGCLGDGDACARRLADLANLAAATANDAANHVGGNADVLRLQFNAILIVRRGRGPACCIGSRSTGVRSGRRIAEVGTVASAVVRASAQSSSSSATVGQSARSSTGLNPYSGVVENGAVSTLVIIDQALANLPNGLLDAGWGTLYFDNALSRLGEHLLLCDHANARCVLDLLDLQALATDDGAHLVVGDEETNGWQS